MPYEFGKNQNCQDVVFSMHLSQSKRDKISNSLQQIDK